MIGAKGDLMGYAQKTWFKKLAATLNAIDRNDIDAVRGAVALVNTLYTVEPLDMVNALKLYNDMRLRTEEANADSPTPETL
jgi:hypothetical protein